MSEPKNCGNCAHFNQSLLDIIPADQRQEKNEARCIVNPPQPAPGCDPGNWRGWAYPVVLNFYPACRHHQPAPAPFSDELWKDQEAIHYIGFNLAGSAREFQSVFLTAQVGRGVDRKAATKTFKGEYGGGGPIAAWSEALDWYRHTVCIANHHPSKINYTDSVEELLQKQNNTIALVQENPDSWPFLKYI